MTAADVRTILAGRFDDEADRQYWESKLAELEAKEARAKENAEYFKTMAVYDR